MTTAEASDGAPGDPAAPFDIGALLGPVRGRPLRRLPRLVADAIRLCWRAARREFVISMVLQAISGAAIAAQLLLARTVLGSVLAAGGRGRFGAILPTLAALALVSAVIVFAETARTEQQRLLAELVGQYAVNQVLEVAAFVDLVAYERPTFHNRLQRAIVNAEIRPLQMSSGVLGMASAVLSIVGIGGALLVLQPVFLVAVLSAYVPAWLLAMRASRVAHEFYAGQTERDRVRLYLRSLLVGKDEAKEVRAFNLSAYLRARHDGLHQERIDGLRAMVARRLRLGLLGGLLTSSLTAAAIALLVWLITTGRLGVAAAAAAAGGVVLLGQRLGGLTSSFGSLFESSLFLEDFTTFVDVMPPMIKARPTLSPPPRFSLLSVDHVSFTYPSRSEPSLRDVTMHIAAGEVVALVGLNGSGKTTLAKLLAGLYLPGEGVISWDGVDAASFDPDQLRERVAVIFQDFVKYSLSAAENIGFGRSERLGDREGIEAAARQSGAHEPISALRDRYDTRLGAQYYGGSDLSVGQWQRVALARAFFRDAPFIVLDEPTAALDPRAELELFDRIRELARGRSVLLISHRFSSVRSADRIYVLSAGEVVEHGSHSELLARDGLYAELFGIQAAAYGPSAV